MKRMAYVLLPLTFAAGAAFANTGTLPVVEDLDASGNFSLTELQAVWPELTDQGFAAIDANADGAVDQAELQTAFDNGVVTPVESNG